MSDRSKALAEMRADLGPFQMFDGPLDVARPHNASERIQLFGDPTRNGLYKNVTRAVDPVWKRQYIQDVHGAEAWLPSLERFYIGHQIMLEEYFGEFCRRADSVCPGYITRMGCFVPRRMRHDTPEKAAARHFHPPLLPLSIHTWGSAGDINSDDNGSCTEHDFPSGVIPLPWTPEWNKKYPKGLPRGVVQAALSTGFDCGIFWVSKFHDPMHIQFEGSGDKQI